MTEELEHTERLTVDRKGIVFSVDKHSELLLLSINEKIYRHILDRIFYTIYLSQIFDSAGIYIQYHFTARAKDTQSK